MLYIPSKKDEVEAILTIERRCINYLVVVVTIWSASIIKVSVQCILKEGYVSAAQ